MGLFDSLAKIKAQQELLNSKNKKDQDKAKDEAARRNADRAKKQKKGGGFADVFLDRGK